jgi:DNA-directed RNA polymerase specialized sigma24 family protein
VVTRRPPDDEAFDAFVRMHEPSLRRAFVAAYGAERGSEATAEALAYAWERWDRVQPMENAVGYLYRVGQSRTRRMARRTPRFPGVGVTPELPWVEPALPAAMQALTEHQRVCVVLVHGYGWQLREVAELLGIAVTTVQNHVERGLAKLRAALEVDDART